MHKPLDEKALEAAEEAFMVEQNSGGGNWGVASGALEAGIRAYLGAIRAGESEAAINKLLDYGEPFNDGRNDGVLLQFKDGRKFFFANRDRLLLTALQADNERLREALQFYADSWCFTTSPKRAGIEWKPKESLLDDCGNVARAALAGQEKKG